MGVGEIGKPECRKSNVALRDVHLIREQKKSGRRKRGVVGRPKKDRGKRERGQEENR